MEKLLFLSWQTTEEPLEVTLAKKAKAGDSAAYTELYKTYNEYLYKIAFSYVKDENKALDIVQECVYKGFLNIHKLKDPSIFKTWITRILINSAINYIKSDNKIVYLNDDSKFVEKNENVSLEEKIDLYDAIDILRENYKIAIILKYFNNKSIDEIAEIMNIPSNTVKSYLRRAKESLSKILKEDYLNEQ